MNINNYEHRKAIAKIRTSSHNLEIETGRWHNIQRESRICKNCALDAVEDEMHFLFNCRMHVIERKILFDTIIDKNADLAQYLYPSKYDLLIKEIFLMGNLSILNALGKFIRNGLQKRENVSCHILPPHYVYYQSNS